MHFTIARPLNFLLVRHAESEKNLENRHGGGSGILTKEGKKQTQYLANFISQKLSINLKTLEIYHSPEDRVINTLIESKLTMLGKTTQAIDFKGINLGKIAGLSDTEVEKQYPDISKAIKAWRSGTGNLGAINSGGESMHAFYYRIFSQLNHIIESTEATTVIIVATTSTLVMITHLLRNNGVYSREKYYFPNFRLGSLNYWQLSKNTFPILIKAKSFNFAK